MSKLESKKSKKKLFTSHIIEANIEEVYNMISDWRNTDHLFRDFVTDTVLIKGKNTSEVGCLFQKIWGGALLEGECLQNISYDNEKIMRWLYVVAKSVKIDITYHLIKNSTDDTTILLWKSVFITKQLLEEALQNEILTRNECVVRWNKFLSKINKGYSQVESLVINRSMEYIWDEIVNWHLFAEIGKIVEWDGPVAQEGSNMMVQYIKNNSKLRFKIINSKHNSEDSTWEYELELYKESSKIPSQEIKFKILKLTDKNSFLIFEHVFNQAINKKDLNSLIKEKRDLLNCFKVHQTKKSKSF